jgi:AcrR family transcriptional regulator
MTLTIERDPVGPNRRRLPIQIANEAKMIRATIELLGGHEVGEITSRMIAERSGTATNYISRYFGGRDALLSATANELGWRIAEAMDDYGRQPELQEALPFLEAVVSMPEVALWFKLFRYLSARNLTVARGPGTRSPVAVACDDAVARIFRLEGDEVQFWSNVFLTYLLGGLSFNALLGTDDDEGGKVLARLGRIVEVLRDEQISLDA